MALTWSLSVLLLLTLHQLLWVSASRPRRSPDSGASTARGKFTNPDKMQCTWRTRESQDKVKLLVRCENPEARIKGGVTDMACDYDGRPARCPGFRSDPRTFWKQVGRALKRMKGKLCTDDRALVKAGMCKRAPRDSHFKMDVGSSVMSAQSGGIGDSGLPGPTACTQSHEQTAQEYCSSTWASVCMFFMSMLQKDNC